MTRVATIVRCTISNGFGSFEHPVAVNDALCPDGKRRKVRLNQDGETGRVSIGGQSRTGYVYPVELRSVTPAGQALDYAFVPFTR